MTKPEISLPEGITNKDKMGPGLRCLNCGQVFQPPYGSTRLDCPHGCNVLVAVNEGDKIKLDAQGNPVLDSPYRRNLRLAKAQQLEVQ